MRRGVEREPNVSLFPIFLKLAGRTCLVVGGGSVGESKIQSLLEAGAKVRLVSPRVNPVVAEWARAGRVTWQRREFEAADLDEVFLVVAATSSKAVNEAVYREAQKRNVLCNAVDDPEHCDFYYPAVVRRGQLQLAISTEGQSPALAQRLRRQLEKQFGPEYAGWVKQLGEARKQLFDRALDPEDRQRRLHELASSGPQDEVTLGTRGTN